LVFILKLVVIERTDCEIFVLVYTVIEIYYFNLRSTLDQLRRRGTTKLIARQEWWWKEHLEC
jgi:hypothetical protein